MNSGIWPRVTGAEGDTRSARSTSGLMSPLVGGLQPRDAPARVCHHDRLAMARLVQQFAFGRHGRDPRRKRGV